MAAAADTAVGIGAVADAAPAGKAVDTLAERAGTGAAEAGEGKEEPAVVEVRVTAAPAQGAAAQFSPRSRDSLCTRVELRARTSDKSK